MRVFGSNPEGTGARRCHSSLHSSPRRPVLASSRALIGASVHPFAFAPVALTGPSPRRPTRCVASMYSSGPVEQALFRWRDVCDRANAVKFPGQPQGPTQAVQLVSLSFPRRACPRRDRGREPSDLWPNGTLSPPTRGRRDRLSEQHDGLAKARPTPAASVLRRRACGRHRAPDAASRDVHSFSIGNPERRTTSVT
jgi:hypothetical protein